MSDKPQDGAVKIEGISFGNAPLKRRKVMKPTAVAAPAVAAAVTTPEVAATTTTIEQETPPTPAETVVDATPPDANVPTAPAMETSAPDTATATPKLAPDAQAEPAADIDASPPKSEAAPPMAVTPAPPKAEPAPVTKSTDPVTRAPSAPLAPTKTKTEASIQVDPSAYEPSVPPAHMPKFCMECGGVIDHTQATCAYCRNVHKPVSQVHVAPQPAATPVTSPKAHDARTTSPTLLAPPDAVTQPVPVKAPSLPPAAPPITPPKATPVPAVAAPAPAAVPPPAAPAPPASALAATTSVAADPAAAADTGTGTLPPPAPNSWIRNNIKTLLICVVVLLAILGAIYLARRGNGSAATQVATNTPNGVNAPPSLPHGPIPVIVQGPIQIQWPSIPDGGIPVAVQGMPTVAVGSLPPLPPVVVNLPSPPVADAGTVAQATITPDASAPVVEDASSNTADAAPDSAAESDAAVTVIATTGATPPADNGQVTIANAGPGPALVPPPGMTCAAAAANAGTPACTAVPSREVTFYNGRTLPSQLRAGWNCDVTRPLDEPLRDGPSGYTANVCAAACVFCR